MRVLLALGGNAMTAADGRARPEDQIAAANVAMHSVAELVASDIDVVVTHGNGPQVGNLLVKNEIAASVVPGASVGGGHRVPAERQQHPHRPPATLNVAPVA